MRADVDETLATILSGGAGSRVDGADKGLLSVGGRPLVERVVERLRPQCERLLIVANRNLDDYARLAPVVRDEVTGYPGPLAGIVAAFGFLAANRQALPRWLLTAPVDCPDPPRDLASRLRATLTADATACCAFVQLAGKAQPLFALYRVDDDPPEWLASTRAALREHGSAWRWHAALEAIAVDFDQTADTFHNLNTPEALREYELAHDAG